MEFVAFSLARQSRAVVQGSAVPLMPKAALEITHVSRGRLVMRTGSFRVVLLDDADGGVLVVCPGDDDMRGSFNFKEWHSIGSPYTKRLR